MLAPLCAQSPPGFKCPQGPFCPLFPALLNLPLATWQNHHRQTHLPCRMGFFLALARCKCLVLLLRGLGGPACSQCCLCLYPGGILPAAYICTSGGCSAELALGTYYGDCTVVCGHKMVMVSLIEWLYWQYCRMKLLGVLLVWLIPLALFGPVLLCFE